METLPVHKERTTLLSDAFFQQPFFAGDVSKALWKRRGIMQLKRLPKLEWSLFYKERQITVHNSFLLSWLKILPGRAAGAHGNVTMLQEQHDRELRQNLVRYLFQELGSSYKTVKLKAGIWKVKCTTVFYYFCDHGYEDRDSKDVLKYPRHCLKSSKIPSGTLQLPND